MNRIKLSLIDNDFSVKAATDIDFHDNQDRNFANFLKQLTEQVVTGETAQVEVEGLERPITFTVAESLF